MLQKWHDILHAKCESMEQIIEEGAGPQVTSGCSFANAAPGNGEGGNPGMRIEETQCPVGGGSGPFKIFARETSPRIS